MSLKKSLLILSVFFTILSPVFSDEDSGESDDLDSLFETSEDSEEAVVTEEVKAGTDYNVQLGTIKLPIEVSGSMSTSAGGAFIRESNSNDLTVYFDFKNYIYFTTRPDKYLALKGVLKSSMPDDGDSSGESHLLSVYELYFDYLMFNHIYITAGKKKSVWGNVRLFSDYYEDSDNDDAEDDDSSDNVTDAQYTNILYDSRDYISGIVKIPFWNHTITGVVMYNDETSNSSPGTKDMSLALSAEFIVFGTSINFFGRRFPLNYSSDSENAHLPIIGLELKRTIFGFDFYGQSMARISDGYKFYDFFKSGAEKRDVFKRVISTVGTYRLWNESTPYVGFNFEFQNIYRPNPSENEEYFTNRFAFEFGLAKLGPDRNIKIAAQWNHNINDWTGFVKGGVIISRIMPHCDWRNGVKYEYGENATSFNKYKLTVGSYFNISLDY